MENRYDPLVALLATAAIVVVVHAQTPPRLTPLNTGRGLLTGRVLDGDARSPVPGALVVVTGRSETAQFGPGLRVLTDNDGRFFFRSLAAASLQVMVTKPGWIPGAFGQHRPGGATQTIDLTDGQRRPDTDITLWKYAVISGRVTDERGDPIVGVNVRAARLSYVAGRQRAAITARAITDDLGVYRFTDLQPGDYYVAVPATVTSEPSTFDGAIRAAGASTPHSYFQTMTTIGAAPMLTTERASVSSSSDQSLLSLVPGMAGLPPVNGQWMTYPTTFFPSAIAASSATVVHAATGRDRSGANIVMRAVPTFRLSGTVIDADGPASHNAVHLIGAESADAPLFDVATAITDGNGVFTMFGVPAGQYIARVVRIPWPADGGQLGLIGGTGAILSVDQFYSSRPGGPPKVSTEPLMSVNYPVSLSDRDLTNVQLTLRTGARIEGRAEFDGTSPHLTPAQLQAVRVPLELANGQASFLLGQGVFDDEGKYATSSLWPARYLIRAPSQSGWTFKSAMYKGRDVSVSALELADGMLASDVVITFTDHPAKVTGRVQSADNVPANASVALLFPADQSGWVDYGRASRTVQSARVSESGTFSMPAPPSGDYLMVAIADADAADWQNPAVLQTLALLATHVQVRDDQPSAVVLTVKRVPR